MRLEGSMQHDHPLTIKHMLDRTRSMYGGAEVVTLGDEGTVRTSYAELGERVDRLCGALAALDIGPGDRVATFGWNTQEHLEAYLAVPSMGAVLHTLNIRLFPEQLTYVVNHAEDQVIIVDDSLVPLLAEMAPSFATVRHFIVTGSGDSGSLPSPLRYEELLAAQEPHYDYPELDDRLASGLCYTSGTTGNPKGVLYSHRSTVLHAFGACLAETLGVTSNDRVLPVVPMFHASAWGLPYASTLVGASLVMPGRFLQAEPLAKLIADEQVTVAGAVPTIWMDLLRHVDEAGGAQPDRRSGEHRTEDLPESDLSSLRLVACGGSAVPRSLMEAFEARHGVRIVQAWGMTETSPLASVAHPPPGVDEEQAWDYRDRAGRISPLLEARLVADDGAEVPWDGSSSGELEVRGPWIASRYYEDPSGDDKFDDGWLRTGDIAAIDELGYIRLTDRAKDVIKSGGEWISSVELENELMGHPGVAEAAVIALPDERWSERPLACVVRAQDAGSECTPAELGEHLVDRVAKWWIPDQFAFINEVPKTSVGKFDKKVLRKRLEEGELKTETRS